MSDQDKADNIVIVSRHPAAIEFVREHLAAQGIDTAKVQVIAQAGPDDVRGMDVFGNVPMHLAAEAREVWAIEFDIAPRGAEYTLADMKAAGARLVAYTVRRAENDQMAAMRKELQLWRDVSVWYNLCPGLDSIPNEQWYGTQLTTLKAMTNATGAMAGLPGGDSK